MEAPRAPRRPDRQLHTIRGRGQPGRPRPRAAGAVLAERPPAEAGVAEVQVSARPAPWQRLDWAAAYRDYREDRASAEGYWLELEEGRVPPDLCGTLYRNGPGEFSVGGARLAHPFDGPGLLASIAFRGGRAFCRARFVATPEREEERGAGRVLYRSTFGTEPQGHWLSRALDLAVRNPANTGVLPWDGACLALFEAGQPYRVDSETLETLGQDFLGGALAPGLPFGSGLPWVDALLGHLLTGLRRARGRPGRVVLGGEALGAHTHTCHASGHTLLFSYRLLLGGWPLPRLQTRVTLRTFTREQELVGTSEHLLEGYAFLHDLAITEQHVIAFQNAVELDAGAFALGRCAPVHSVRWQQRPFTVHVWPHPEPGAPRERSHRPRPAPERCRVPPPGQQQQPAGASPAFVFHTVNAFEGPGPGEITVDCVRYSSMPDFHQACGGGRTFTDSVDPARQPPSELWRYRLCGASGAVLGEARLSDWVAEFPAVSPRVVGRPHRYIFAAAAFVPGYNLPQQALLRLDTAPGGRAETWAPGLRWYTGEPILVPKRGPQGEEMQGELDAWVLQLAFNAADCSSHVLIFDAGDVEQGPVAKLRLRQPLPHGLHGAWSDVYHGPKGR